MGGNRHRPRTDDRQRQRLLVLPWPRLSWAGRTGGMAVSRCSARRRPGTQEEDAAEEDAPNPRRPPLLTRLISERTERVVRVTTATRHRSIQLPAPGGCATRQVAMTLSTRRLTSVVVAAAAVVIAAVAVTSLGPDHSEPQKYPVPMPAPGASARQVVLAYLHALDAHDTATAEQLSTAGFAPRHAPGCSPPPPSGTSPSRTSPTGPGKPSTTSTSPSATRATPGPMTTRSPTGTHTGATPSYPATAACSSVTTAPDNHRHARH